MIMGKKKNLQNLPVAKTFEIQKENLGVSTHFSEIIAVQFGKITIVMYFNAFGIVA